MTVLGRLLPLQRNDGKRPEIAVPDRGRERLELNT
jgi:hypothetical protein